MKYRVKIFSYMDSVWRSSRLLKFLLVGVLNTIVGYTIFLIVLWVGLHYSLAIATATVLGAMFNFKSTGALVFKSRDNSRLLRFTIVYSVIYGLNVAGVAALIQLGMQAWLAGLILLLPLALLSYLLNSRYVFYHEKENQHRNPDLQ